MGKYITIKAGDADRGLEMFSTENFLRLEGAFDGDPIRKMTTPSPVSFALCSEVWGKRVVDAETKKPTGEILVDKKWGEGISDGYGVINTQFHPSFKSFDYDYQDTNKMLLREDSDELFIEINQGTTAFEMGTNMATYLSLFHSNNGSNPARNPNKPILFEEYNVTEEVEAELQKEEVFFNAMKVVLDLKSNEAKAYAYAKVFGIDQQKAPMSIIQDLRLLVKADADNFNLVIEKHKGSILKMLNSAISNEVARFTKKGDLELLNGTDKYSVIGKVEDYSSSDKAIKGIAQNALEEYEMGMIKEVKEALDNYNKK